MRCERAQELFSDYCDGSMQAALRVPFESHLHDCAHCRADVDDLRAIWQTLDEAPLMSPPANFRATVWSRIDAAEQSAPSRRRFAFDWKMLWSRPALVWAGAALLLLVLTPVVVPGRFSTAGLLNLIPGRSSAWHIRAAAPQASGGQFVVPLTVDAVAEVPARVTVVSGPAQIESGNDITLGPQTPAQIRLQPQAAGGQITLEVAWQQDGQQRSQRLTVDLPR